MDVDTTLLSRLVERQHSSRPGVQPVLSSLFEPPDLDQGDPEAALVEVEELVQAPQPAKVEQVRASSSTPRAVQSDQVEHSRVLPMASGPGPADPGTGQEAAPATPRRTATPAPATPDEPVAVRHTEEPADVTRALPAPLVRPKQAEPHQPARARAQQPEVGVAVSGLQLHQAPEPLLGPTPERTRSAEGRAVAVRSPDRAPTRPPEPAGPPAEQPITVSVRIGRIEVRAPAAATPAAPSAGAAGAPGRPRHEPRLSLEDYLARPNRGRS